MRIDYRRRPNARRYILRVNSNGDGGCVTIPRGGSWAEARRFVLRNADWLEGRLRRWQERKKLVRDENKILFRGDWMELAEFFVRFPMTGGPAEAGTPNISPAIAEAAMRKLAERELPLRVAELAALHALTVNRVSVRNQRSRWGSCSIKGVVSLNWRLLQAPEFVRDYIIIHELMHLRQMNHSAKFWELVYAAFPRTGEAEKWLKAHGGILRE